MNHSYNKFCSMTHVFFTACDSIAKFGQSSAKAQSSSKKFCPIHRYLTSLMRLDFLHCGCLFNTHKYFSTEYEVKEIVARRLDREVAKMGIATTDPTLFEYQLKWKGYHKLSWVPFEDLKCPDLLNEFLKSVS